MTAVRADFECLRFNFLKSILRKKERKKTPRSYLLDFRFDWTQSFFRQLPVKMLIISQRVSNIIKFSNPPHPPNVLLGKLPTTTKT